MDAGDVAYSRSANVDSVLCCRGELISNDDLVILAQIDMTPCECAARSRLIYDKADQVCPLQRQLFVTKCLEKKASLSLKPRNAAIHTFMLGSERRMRHNA